MIDEMLRPEIPDLRGTILKALRSINQRTKAEVSVALGIEEYQYDELENGVIPHLADHFFTALEKFYPYPNLEIIRIFKSWDRISNYIRTIDVTLQLAEYQKKEIYILEQQLQRKNEEVLTLKKKLETG